MTEQTDWVPEACTLPTAEQPLRRAEFDALFARAVRRGDRVSATHLRFTLAGEAGLEATVRDLAARENECCTFFSFTIGSTGPGEVQLDVEVPAAHVDVLDALAAWARRCPPNPGVRRTTASTGE